jgi:hypothetical protein
VQVRDEARELDAERRLTAADDPVIGSPSKLVRKTQCGAASPDSVWSTWQVHSSIQSYSRTGHRSGKTRSGEAATSKLVRRVSVFMGTAWSVKP